MARGAFHHALIVPATFFIAHPNKPGHGAKKIRHEALYDSEDLARHLANYVMNQIPTLSIAHISSNDIIAPDIWTDPFRVYACLFVKASKILFLVTQQDVEGFANFMIQRLQPLLEQVKAFDYDWKSRFLVVAMGEFLLPESTPCEVIRFREIGWFRDSMALFVLGKKIQEFWTPIDDSSESITKTEKLSFLTNVEETETFKAAMHVKNVPFGNLMAKQEIDLGTASVHETDDRPNFAIGQNFSFLIDIESDHLLDIRELLISQTSPAGLGGMAQPYSLNARCFSARSELGFTGSSSDLDVGSTVLDEARTSSESVGEMRWSSPDSASIVREANVKAFLSPNDDEQTNIVNEADGPNAMSTSSVTKKISAETLEIPIPTKRKRKGTDRFIDQPNDISSACKTQTFKPKESEFLHNKGVLPKVTRELPTKIQLDPIQERSVEHDSITNQNQCSSEGQRSVKTESEVKSLNREKSSKMTTKESTADQKSHFEVEPSNLEEQDDLSGYAEAELLQSPGLSHLTLLSSGATEELSRSDEFKSAPGFFNIIDKTSGYNTMTSACGRVPQPNLLFSDRKSLLSTREETNTSDESGSVIRSAKSDSPGVSKKIMKIKHRSRSLTDEGTAVKNNDCSRARILETRIPSGTSRPELRKKSGDIRERQETPSPSSVQMGAMPQSEDFEGDTAAEMTNLDCKHRGDTHLGHVEKDFTTQLKEIDSRDFHLKSQTESNNTKIVSKMAEKHSMSEPLLSALIVHKSKDYAARKWFTSPSAVNSPTNLTEFEFLEVRGRSSSTKQERTAQIQSRLLPDVNTQYAGVSGSKKFENADVVKKTDALGEIYKMGIGLENAIPSKLQGIRSLIEDEELAVGPLRHPDQEANEKPHKDVSKKVMGQADAEAVPLKPKLSIDEGLTLSSSRVNSEQIELKHNLVVATNGDSLAKDSLPNDLTITRTGSVKNVEGGNTANAKSEENLNGLDAKRAVDFASEPANVAGVQQSSSEPSKKDTDGDNMADKSKSLGEKADKVAHEFLCSGRETASGGADKNVSKEKNDYNSLEPSAKNVPESAKLFDAKDSQLLCERRKLYHGILADSHAIKTTDQISMISSIPPNEDSCKTVPKEINHRGPRYSISDQRVLNNSLKKLSEVQGCALSMKPGVAVDNQGKTDFENEVKGKEDFQDEKSAPICRTKQKNLKLNDYSSVADTANQILSENSIICEKEHLDGDRHEPFSESDRKCVKEKPQNNGFSKFFCHKSPPHSTTVLAKIDQSTSEKPVCDNAIKTVKTALMKSSFSSDDRVCGKNAETANHVASKNFMSDHENLTASFSEPPNPPDSKFDVRCMTIESECFPTMKDETRPDCFKSDNFSNTSVSIDRGQGKAVTNANEPKEQKITMLGRGEKAEPLKKSESTTDVVEPGSDSLFSSMSNYLSFDKLSKKVSFQNDGIPSQKSGRCVTREKSRPKASSPEDCASSIPICSPGFTPQAITVVRKSTIEQATEVVEHKIWRSKSFANPIGFESSAFVRKSDSSLEGRLVETTKFYKGWNDEMLKTDTSTSITIPKDSVKQEKENRKQKTSQDTRTNRVSDFVEKKSGEYIQSEKCPIPSNCSPSFSDSDCDPEITSWTMTRPWHLWASDQNPSSHMPPLITPRTKRTLEILAVPADKADQNHVKQSDMLTSTLCPASAAKAMKSGAMVQRRKSGEIRAKNDNRLSTISISDGEDQKPPEVVDAETGSNSSKSRVGHRPRITSVQILHEIGEYQRNLGTQLPNRVRNQADVTSGPYYRQLREDARVVGENQLKYWHDRSAGSPNPLEFSVGFDTTSDVSIESEISGISNMGVETRDRMAEALISVHKALGKASKILTNSNKIIIKQVEQLKMEK